MDNEPQLPLPSRNLEEIQLIDESLTLPSFTSQTAWTLGSLLRSKLVQFSKSTVIDISLAHQSHFLRWNSSTWYMHNKFVGDEAAFATKFALGQEAGKYAIHGGGWPVRVRGVEGIVAVVVVSGLRQEQDHAIIVQTVSEMLEELREELESEAGDVKKKED
ncbi:uncharacterized protein LTR77_008167 [Saxophila tyrrhenica]|uniref:Uncharacterized protein n=1 Tax=Saxophila tyrrhenica TaxID=1690608 RepID=A0AAV9P211_9PEZI|nr:hypothetical protein LTR77_008167 [Saxophila tyrrhenica]